MTYQPVLPASGNVGWAFLKKTRQAQQEAFAGSISVQRLSGYFREKVGEIQTAEGLVADRRLLTVALGAFGLSDDIENSFYIRKVLEEGTKSDEAFANRLADKRYFELAKAFGFDEDPPNTSLPAFADTILGQYATREFEVAVGEQDENLRLALGLGRDLRNLAGKGLSERAGWFTVMGTPPLRAVFEKALGLPPQTAALDLDRQLEIFREKSLSAFGVTDPAAFTNSERQEDLIRRFLLRTDLDSFAASTARGSVALTLLQSQPPLFP